MARYSQQNFSKVNPDGSITGLFPGGIEMLAAAVGTPQGSRRITWVQQENGAVVATVSAFSGPAGEERSVGMVALGVPGEGANAAIVSGPESGGNVPSAVIMVNLRDPELGDLAGVTVSTIQDGIGAPTFGLRTRTLMDGFGRSGFAMTPTDRVTGVPLAGAGTLLCSGYVLSNGAKFQVNAGDFTSVRNGLGDYSVTFTRAFGNTGITALAIPTNFGPGGIPAETRCITASSTTARWQFFGSAGAALDVEFAFLCVGQEAIN